jgi:TRAP-type mannitol/chloroaromatic compound transport system substrate-binding protein
LPTSSSQFMVSTCRGDKLKFETFSKSFDVIKDELNFTFAIVHELRITNKDNNAWKNVFDLQKKFAKRNIEFTEIQEEAKERRRKGKRICL